MAIPTLPDAIVFDREPSRAGRRLGHAAGAALKAAAASWFAVAMLGQLAFATYVAGFYGRVALHGDFDQWNAVMPHGYVPGDRVGNAVVGMHLAVAMLIMASGALQLMPWIRRRAPGFHRWNGRVYLLTALAAGMGGMAMIWGGRAIGDLSQNLGISLNALLMLACAGMAWREARARRFDRHRRWAIRLFLVVGGVWFFRLGLTLWIAINQAPVGFNPRTFEGPTLTILAFAQYALPLAIAELYFRAQQSHRPSARLAMAAGLVVAALVTAAGTATASMMLWLPHL